MNGLVTNIIITVISGLLFVFFAWLSLVQICDRMYPHNSKQTLATECYVQEAISKKADVKEKVENDCYFFAEDKDVSIFYKKGDKIVGKIVDSSPTEFKVTYNILSVYGSNYKHTEWLPKHKVFKYYTTEELSEIINNERRGKR